MLEGPLVAAIFSRENTAAGKAADYTNLETFFFFVAEPFKYE